MTIDDSLHPFVQTSVHVLDLSWKGGLGSGLSFPPYPLFYVSFRGWIGRNIADTHPGKI